MSKVELSMGGQALIEGVLIRSPHCVSVAVRKPDGIIIKKSEKFESISKRIKVLSWPILRGIVNLIEMMMVGIRALDYSAQHALDTGKEEEKLSRTASTISLIFSIIISLAIAIFFFKFIPLFLTEQLRKIFPILADYAIVFNLVDGLIRIGIFFLYIFVLSLIPSFRRIFEYHGAEHKSIFAHEKGHELTPEIIQKESPRHPRCGTSFIIIVLIISILILSFVPRHPIFWINLIQRIAILPLIAGVAYEILKFTAKYEKNIFVRMLTYPGIFTQYITTKEPDNSQVEVAIAAVQGALEYEKTHKT